mmetsp:Transcript_7468/g.33206  ORF Transcript_7468/g.33206 Transcript_7468/m.33206 type:complete len:461 (+) Transcript_7468:1331-2713(+)
MSNASINASLLDRSGDAVCLARSRRADSESPADLGAEFVLLPREKSALKPLMGVSGVRPPGPCAGVAAVASSPCPVAGVAGVAAPASDDGVPTPVSSRIITMLFQTLCSRSLRWRLALAHSPSIATTSAVFVADDTSISATSARNFSISVARSFILASASLTLSAVAACSATAANAALAFSDASLAFSAASSAVDRDSAAAFSADASLCAFTLSSFPGLSVEFDVCLDVCVATPCCLTSPKDISTVLSLASMRFICDSISTPTASCSRSTRAVSSRAVDSYFSAAALTSAASIGGLGWVGVAASSFAILLSNADTACGVTAVPSAGAGEGLGLSLCFLAPRSSFFVRPSSSSNEACVAALSASVSFRVRSAVLSTEVRNSSRSSFLAVSIACWPRNAIPSALVWTITDVSFSSLCSASTRALTSSIAEETELIEPSGGPSGPSAFSLWTLSAAAAASSAS